MHAKLGSKVFFNQYANKVIGSTWFCKWFSFIESHEITRIDRLHSESENESLCSNIDSF